MMHSRFTLGFLEAHPRVAARTLENLEQRELVEFLASLPPRLAARIAHETTPSLIAAGIAAMEPRQAADIVQHLDVDLCAMLLRRIERAARGQILARLPVAMAAAVRLILRYPEDTIGSIVNPDVLSVPEEMTVKDILRQSAMFKEQLLHAIYVIDNHHALTGTLDIRELFTAESGRAAGEIMRKPDAVLMARTGLSAARQHPAWSSHNVLPVVDFNRRFLGVVHRAALAKAADSNPGSHDAVAGLTGTVLALSELLWNACAEVFMGYKPAAKKRSGEPS